MTNADIQQFVTRDFIGQNPSIFEQRPGATITPVTYPTEVQVGFQDAQGQPVTVDPASPQGGAQQFLEASGASVPDPSTVTPMKITVTVVDVFETIKQLDEHVFDQVENNGAGT